jgi:hypothetical protein
VNVPVNPDQRIEGNETFRLLLSGAVNAVLVATQATATVFDDDGLGLNPSGWSSFPKVGRGDERTFRSTSFPKQAPTTGKVTGWRLGRHRGGRFPR